MIRFTPTLPLAALCALMSVSFAPRARAGETARRMEVSYQFELPAAPAGAQTLELWVPLIGDDAHQRLLDRRIEASFPYTITTDPLFHNTLLHARLPAATIGTLRIVSSVNRWEAAAAATRLKPAERSLYLRAERKVTLSSRVRAIAAKITAGKKTARGKAQAIYDYTVAVMSYDKTLPGWGEGDTERACDVKKGNCTDFHSLFISLARASRVPARFIMGYSVPSGAPSGDIQGYHCWAEYHDPASGWVPVDASEASKHPERKKYLFGRLDADRVSLSLGRDVILAPPQAGDAVNYLLKPYVEFDGTPAPAPAVKVSYADLPPDVQHAEIIPAAPSPAN